MRIIQSVLFTVLIALGCKDSKQSDYAAKEDGSGGLLSVTRDRGPLANALKQEKKELSDEFEQWANALMIAIRSNPSRNRQLEFRANGRSYSYKFKETNSEMEILGTHDPLDGILLRTSLLIEDYPFKNPADKSEARRKLAVVVKSATLADAPDITTFTEIFEIMER